MCVCFACFCAPCVYIALRPEEGVRVSPGLELRPTIELPRFKFKECVCVWVWLTVHATDQRLFWVISCGCWDKKPFTLIFLHWPISLVLLGLNCSQLCVLQILVSSQWMTSTMECSCYWTRSEFQLFRKPLCHREPLIRLHLLLQPPYWTCTFLLLELQFSCLGS